MAWEVTLVSSHETTYGRSPVFLPLFIFSFSLPLLLRQGLPQACLKGSFDFRYLRAHFQLSNWSIACCPNPSLKREGPDFPGLRLRSTFDPMGFSYKTLSREQYINPAGKKIHTYMYSHSVPSKKGAQYLPLNCYRGNKIERKSHLPPETLEPLNLTHSSNCRQNGISHQAISCLLHLTSESFALKSLSEQG